MTVSPDQILSIVVAVVGFVIVLCLSIIGWLVVHAIKRVEDNINEIKTTTTAGFAKLTDVDTKIQIELAEVRTRLVALEHMVHGVRRAPTGEAKKT